MPKEDSVQKVDGVTVRFKTAKFGIAVYRQRYLDRGKEKFSRPFYYSKTVGGRLVRFPVGVDMRSAEKLAEEIAGYLSDPRNTLDMAIAKYNPRQAERANTVATYQDVLDKFEEALTIIGRNGKPVSAGTFKGYRSFLATFLRRVEAYQTGQPFVSFMGRSNVDFSPWFNQPVDLTVKHAMDFKIASMPTAPEGEEEPDEEEILTAKISADTVLRSTRALFSRQALRYYKTVGVNLPDLTGFMSEPLFGAKKFFELLPPHVIVELARASLTLREADKDGYRAYLLTMHCGLRRGEAKAFRKSWLRDEDAPMLYVTTKGEFNPKHGHGRKVEIERWVADTLNELGPIEDAGALDRLNDWVKARIPKENAVYKGLHELRKCWVSAKAKSEGIHAASKQAGHKDVKVTTTSYADNLMAERLLPIWKEPTEQAINRFAAA
jgi:integrase